MRGKFFRHPLEITRFDGRAELNLDGTYSLPNTKTLTIIADVQPAKGFDMEGKPEGRRSYRTVNIYTDDELIAANQKTGQQADRFEYLGVVYEVTSVTCYRGGIFNHYNGVATEVNNH